MLVTYRIRALLNFVHHTLCQKSHLVYRIQFSDKDITAEVSLVISRFCIRVLLDLMGIAVSRLRPKQPGNLLARKADKK